MLCRKMIFASLLLCSLLFQANGEVDGIKFYVYQSWDPESPQIIDDNANLTTVSPEKPLKILCHGWLDNGTLPWTVEMKDNYMETGIETFISVDWNSVARDILYPVVVRKTPQVGDIIGKLVLNINKKFGVPLENVHLIGHSLGGQIVGFAGQYIARESGQKVGRITGLDPAGPLYNLAPDSQRLSKDDAQFVDVIHTSLEGWVGSLGHVDFWPNGGRVQEGCQPLTSCDHLRSRVYFIDSILSKFVAWKCDSYESFKDGECFENEMNLMGDPCSNSARGDFYLQTNPEEPFAKTSY